MNFNRMGEGVGAVGGEGLVPEAKSGELARQLSVYSLTFDEFQSTHGGIGKDFGSMNMDELLKNIWTAEESHAMAGTSAAGFSDAGLQKQGSFTLPRTLSQRTVDEVWRDLVNPPQAPSTYAAAHGVSHQHPQPTLGEMTLEEFLVRAGVVREEPAVPSAVLPLRPIGDSRNSSGNKNTAINNVMFGDLPGPSNASGLPLGFCSVDRTSRDVITNPVSNIAAANLAMMAAAAEQSAFAVVDLANSQGIRGGGLVGINEAGMSTGLMPGPVGLGAAAGSIAIASTVNNLPSDSMGKSGRDQSSVSPVSYAFTGGLRGRKSSGMERVYERRQRRMIKNRESAARSRARKQAYTMELEAEVAKLKELNQELQKKQVEIMEMQKNKVLEMIEQQRGPKKRCLRRTQTGPW